MVVFPLKTRLVMW